MEVDGQVDIRTGGFPQFGETVCGRVHEGLVLDDPGRAFRVWTRLEAGEPLRDPVLDRCRIAAALVNADPVPRRTAQQLVYRHAQGLARQVPQRLLHPAERTGQDRAAPVEGVAIHGLPVMDHPGRVLADQIGFQFGHRLGAGLGPALQDRLAESDQALVGVDLEKEPAGLDQEGFQLGDFHDVGFSGIVLSRYRAPHACRHACMWPRVSAAMTQHCSSEYSRAPMTSRFSGPPYPPSCRART